MWAEEGNASGRYKQTQEKSPERMAFNTSEGPGPCGDSYTESTSKALMPWGLRVDINAVLLACPPCPNPSVQKRLVGGLSSQVPLSPPRCWDPAQEKNVYLKTDSSKGVGAGDPNGTAKLLSFPKLCPRERRSICLQQGGMPASSSS